METEVESVQRTAVSWKVVRRNTESFILRFFAALCVMSDSNMPIFPRNGSPCITHITYMPILIWFLLPASCNLQENLGCELFWAVQGRLCLFSLKHCVLWFRVVSPPLIHTWMSHVSQVNESYLTRQWVVSHVNESCLIRQWGMSHTSMRHVSHVNEACLTRQWGKSYTSMSLPIPRSKSSIDLHTSLPSRSRYFEVFKKVDDSKHGVEKTVWM